MSDPEWLHQGFEPDGPGHADVPASDMSHVMADLQFDPTGVPSPWDEQGNLAAEANVVGSPTTDSWYWQPQTTGFTCAVMAQRGIIEAFTGEPVSEAQLVYEATTLGWLSDGGMSPDDVGKLLELHGVPCHAVQGALVQDLVAELSLGHKVIVGVDSGELWGQDSPLEDFWSQAADHAIWVTGVDLSDPEHAKVVINDSGDPDGAGKAYDLDLFVDAWQDSGFVYVATDQASPNFIQECEAYDPATGSIPQLASYFGARFEGFAERLNQAGESESALNPPDLGAGSANAEESGLPSLDRAARDALLRRI